MKKTDLFAVCAAVSMLMVGCATKTTLLADGEVAQTTAGFNMDNVDNAVGRAVQNLLQLDRIKLLPGASRAVTIVPETKIDTLERGSSCEALAEEICIRLRETLTNCGKIIVLDPKAAQYATGKVPEAQYVLDSVLRQRNVRQDNGDFQIQYSLNLKLIDRATGLEYWQKTVPLRKVADKKNAM